MMQSRTKESGVLDPLLGEILEALDLAGVSRTRFGYLVVGDPTLIPKMERGRRIKKPALLDAIRRSITSLRIKSAAAAALE